MNSAAIGADLLFAEDAMRPQIPSNILRNVHRRIALVGFRYGAEPLQPDLQDWACFLHPAGGASMPKNIKITCAGKRRSTQTERILLAIASDFFLRFPLKSDPRR